jgi:hypothetical protein
VFTGMRSASLSLRSEPVSTTRLLLTRTDFAICELGLEHRRIVIGGHEDRGRDKRKQGRQRKPRARLGGVGMGLC